MSPWATTTDLTVAAAAIANAASAEWEITLHEITSMGNGSQANNPWLLEMPDPVSKVVWDNYIAMSPKRMQEMGLRIIHEKEEPFSVVELTVNGVTVKAPVFPQPGQPDGTIAIAYGFGHTAIGKAADGIGTNAFSMLTVNGEQIINHSNRVSIKPIDETYMLVSTQTHHTLMGRHMVKETTLAEYSKDAHAGNHKEKLVVSDGHKHEKKDPRTLDLWATPDNKGFDKPGLFWNMSIDLSSCIGCGNCVVSCQAENNVAVVGKDEVRKTREMHWIRIDRYYSSDTTKENVPDGTGVIDTYKLMEIPSENPTVVFQPVMCQHCNHAPCETVCPVLATTHSNEGLNQMTYNRCVGTKYCANNCPYKVRRFNWFKYFDNSEFDFNMNNDLGKMVLNPDVTVRSRGVMEKCSMCIQRIQEGKLNAKKEGRKIVDGEVKTACQQSCPTEAITFGNANDPSSKIAAANKDERSYNILEELAVLPSVYYWVKVRNTDEPAHSGGHHA
jgi:molybdopterin-containing oxidoreductase family iron-sulfur binding subunit